MTAPDNPLNKNELDKLWVEIHFKENGIPSIIAGKLTEKSKAAIVELVSTHQDRRTIEARIDEVNSLHDDLSLEAREAGACDAIHKRTNHLNEQLAPTQSQPEKESNV